MSESSNQRTCATCVLCLRQDYGYSNYTTEGTEFFCLPGLNPALDGLDEAYGEMTPTLAAALDVALQCSRYRFGAPATLDVDHDGIPYDGTAVTVTPEIVKSGGYTDDDEAAALLAVRLSPEARS